jgi:asparagine synthase (glutamine-hydrolysing)
MCAIAGLIYPKQNISKNDQAASVKRMLDKMSHRGPDGEGLEIQETSQWRIVFGHRRLSIIDLQGGHQPMLSQRSMITYNGEVLNYQELKKEISQDFKTTSDTEAILASFDKFETKSFAKLNGFFAFGIWDFKQESLFLCRDRFGIKPLYYCKLDNGGIVFSSELNALMLSNLVKKTLNHEALVQYFFHNSFPWHYTPIQGISKVLPGETIKWHQGNIAKEYYFNPTDLLNMQSDDSFEMAKIKTQSLIQNAVKRHLISDVPSGVFLSGGIDSSIICYEAAQLCQHKLETFSIGFDRPDYDESIYARQVANLIQSNHHEEIVSIDQMESMLQNVVSALDEPLGDSSIIPTMMVSQMARKRVKVVLGGDGGDELFAGYPILKAHAYAEKYKPLIEIFRTCGFSHFIEKLKIEEGQKGLHWQLKKFILRFDNNMAWRHQKWMAGIRIETLPKLFKSELANFAQKDILQFKAIQKITDKNALLLIDLMNFLANDVITKVDRASMSQGLEARPPFLDNELASYTFSLPFHFKYNNGQSKYILKEIYKSKLPHDILFRKKQGFSIPMPVWMRGKLAPAMKTIINESVLFSNSGPFNKATWLKLLDEHLNYQEDHAVTLWNLFVFHHWHDKNVCN